MSGSLFLYLLFRTFGSRLMHILEIPSFFPPYGGEFCLEQAKALAAQGHEVRIVSNVQLGVTGGVRPFVSLPFTRFEHEMDGIVVYQSYQRGCPKAVRYNVRRWVAIVRSMVREYITKYGRPDMLHAHCVKWAGYAVMLLSREYHIPYVVTEHLSRLVYEPEFGRAPSDAWQIAFLKEAYRDADMVIPVSERLVDDVSCYFGTDYRWTSVSNVVDVAYFHYQQRPSLQGRRFRFCCLANFWPLKGYDVLFDAFCTLRSQGCDVELHIAGRGTDSAACRALLPEGTITHGWLERDAVRALLYESDALVLASRSEVQPLALLEAMSTGIPVVATEVVPESMRIEEACYVVPTDDAAALAGAMRQVMCQENFDGRKASERVARLASPQVVGERLSALFSEIADASHSPQRA